MMKNRSFDHVLGWLPGADDKQAGLSYPDRYGLKLTTHRLAAGDNDSLAIGYYTQPDLAFFGQAAPAWTTCDRYFSAVIAETHPNRFYQHRGADRPAAQGDGRKPTPRAPRRTTTTRCWPRWKTSSACRTSATHRLPG
jgi:phospholipase C